MFIGSYSTGFKVVVFMPMYVWVDEHLLEVPHSPGAGEPGVYRAVDLPARRVGLGKGGRRKAEGEKRGRRKIGEEAREGRGYFGEGLWRKL